jgi:GNAT superfamily N-acetyltransferase
MAADDHLNGQQFAVHAGKYAIQYEPNYVPTVVARQLDSEGNPGPQKAGDFSHDSSGGIYSVFVRSNHRREGLASAMLGYAREQNPDLNFRHSDKLSENGAAWANARPL